MSYHNKLIELLCVSEPCVAVEQQAGVVCRGRACTVKGLEVGCQVVDVLCVQVLWRERQIPCYCHAVTSSVLPIVSLVKLMFC